MQSLEKHPKNPKGWFSNEERGSVYSGQTTKCSLSVVLPISVFRYVHSFCKLLRLWKFCQID